MQVPFLHLSQRMNARHSARRHSPTQRKGKLRRKRNGERGTGVVL